jgi:hypothetical protein
MTTTITEIIKGLKEGDLTKNQLEEYSSMLDILCAELEMSLADIEKAEAMFLANCGEKTRSGATTQWDASEAGQKEIELKRNIRAVSKLASSAKTRIYQRL